MTRLRPIKKYGNTWVITLTSPDVNDLGLKEGDMVDIEDMVVNKKEEAKKK